MNLLQNEILDDLQISNLKIIQKKDGFKFGTDAVLLSDYAKTVPSSNTLDLCTGSGIVPILLSAKTSCEKFYGIEIQKDYADMAQRSVEMNGLDDRIKIINADLKNSIELFGKRSFDLITCNPPYIRSNSAVLNQADSKIIARHEVMCSLEDIISVASSLISLTGHFVMVHRPSRLCDIIFLMRKYSIEPKRMRFVQKTADDTPSLVLIDGLYKGKSELKIAPPLILQNKDGTETQEYKIIYSKGEQ